MTVARYLFSVHGRCNRSRSFSRGLLSLWLVVAVFAIPGLGEEIEISFDGAEPDSGLGDIGWSLAERPDGGFLIVGEHLLDETVDSYNRKAIVVVTNARGEPQGRLPLPSLTHAAKIRALSSGEYLIAGNKKGAGASIVFVNADGEILRERANVAARKSRPSAGVDAIATTDGGYLVACKESLCGFLAKLDGELSTTWVTEPVENLYYVKSAVRLPSGDCYMVGQHGSGKGIHIARWDAKGRFVGQAVHTIDASVNKGRRILLNKAGNLAITGMVGSGGRGHFLFMELRPGNLSKPLVAVRVDPRASISNYGQSMIQCRDGTYVIAGRSGMNRSHFLSVVRINGRGEIIGGPKYFGSNDTNSGEVGYDLIECHDGAIAIVGLRGTALQNGGKITDVSPSADFYLVKTRI